MPETGFDNRRPLRGMISRLERLGTRDRVRLSELLSAFGEASFVPALTVPALLVVSPLSGIPFFSSICNISIALIAAQILARRRHLRLPGVILGRQIRGDNLRAGLARLNRIADWIDRPTTARLSMFRQPPFSLVAPLGCLVCGLAMPFLELVPFSSSVLGTAVIFFSISLLARDGLFVVLGLAVMGVGALIRLFVYNQIAGP